MLVLHAIIIIVYLYRTSALLVGLDTIMLYCIILGIKGIEKHKRNNNNYTEIIGKKSLDQ